MEDSQPNIIWLTLESVRADHTTVNGYERDTTPNLQRIADHPDGASFTRCMAQSIWTPASSASILTGTYLFNHTVGLDGKAERPLPNDIDTLPQLLSKAGYRTACLSPNAYLSPATGLDRGFDNFLWISKTNLHKHKDTIWPLAKYITQLNKYGLGFTLDGRKHNKTYVMMQVMKQWISSLSESSKPFFLYAHCPNPHHPYTPPRKYLREYTNEITMSAEEALELSLETFRTQDHMKRTIANGCDFTPEEWDGLRAMYDAEISYADEFIGSIFESIQQNKMRETIVIITADHGDLFGERGLLGHNLVLNDGLIHVPLVIHGLPPLQQTSDNLTQHIDITRTIAEYIGCTSDQFDGVNIFESNLDYAISQRGEAQFDTYLKHNPNFDVSRYHQSPITSLRGEKFKYIKGKSGKELYDLPNEEIDVSEKYPEIEEEMDNKLEEILGSLNLMKDRGQTARYSDEMKQQLQDLGYL